MAENKDYDALVEILYPRILERLLAGSTAAGEIERVNSLEGIKTLAAYRRDGGTEKPVEVPLELLADPGNTLVALPIDFTESETRNNIGSGETIPTIFGKIRKWFSSLGGLAFKNKVGGVNLVMDTEEEKTGNSAGYLRYMNLKRYFDSGVLKIGDTYTISADVKVSIPTDVTIYALGTEDATFPYYTTKVGSEWQRISTTNKFSHLSSIMDLSFYTAQGNNPPTARRIKIERGDVATDWSPSPTGTQYINSMNNYTFMRATNSYNTLMNIAELFIGNNNDFGIRIYNNGGNDFKDLRLNCDNGTMIWPGTLNVTDVISSSDRRLKKNVTPLSDESVERILDILPYCYEKSGRREYGYIAQDVQQVAPEIVHKENNSGMLALSYRETTVFLIEALRRKIVKLEEQVKTLENQ